MAKWTWDIYFRHFSGVIDIFMSCQCPYVKARCLQIYLDKFIENWLNCISGVKYECCKYHWWQSTGTTIQLSSFYLNILEYKDQSLVFRFSSKIENIIRAIWSTIWAIKWYKFPYIFSEVWNKNKFESVLADMIFLIKFC